MKKKVLPPFHQHYTAAEELLISECKSHFTRLKLEGLVVIPFAFMVGATHQVNPINPSGLNENPDLSFIEQFWQLGAKHLEAKEALCFAVCYDAHVFDAEEVDQDALVIMLQQEDGKQLQLNIPYVSSDKGLVFGESWNQALEDPS